MPISAELRNQILTLIVDFSNDNSDLRMSVREMDSETDYIIFNLLSTGGSLPNY